MSEADVQLDTLNAVLDAASKRSPRRVVQVAADGGFIFALCNDGTFWEMNSAYKKHDGWTQIPPVPRRDVLEYELHQSGKLAMAYKSHEAGRLANELDALLKAGQEKLEVVTFQCNADTGKREEVGREEATEWLKIPV